MLVCSFEIPIPSKVPKTEVYEESKRVISEYGFGCFILNTDALSKIPVSMGLKAAGQSCSR